MRLNLAVTFLDAFSGTFTGMGLYFPMALLHLFGSTFFCTPLLFRMFTSTFVMTTHRFTSYKIWLAFLTVSRLHLFQQRPHLCAIAGQAFPV